MAMAGGKKESGGRGIGIVEWIEACELRGHNQKLLPRGTLRPSCRERRKKTAALIGWTI